MFRSRNRLWGRLYTFFILPAGFRRQVNLSLTLIDQGDVGFDEEVVPRHDAALVEPGLGFHGAGDGDPYVPLRLGERAPTGGDGGEGPANRGLRRGAWVKRDKGGIGVLAIAVALPNPVPAFARLRDIQDFHN